MRTNLIALGIAAMLVTSCAVDQPTGVADTGTTVAAKQSTDQSATKFWEVGASVGWNRHAATLMDRRQADAIRFMAYISMAQYRAAEAAQAAPGPHPPIAAAIGGASAAIMRELFPLDGADIDRWLAEQRAADRWPGAKHDDFAAGVAIGRSVAAAVRAHMLTDNWTLTSPGTPPTGAGRWAYNPGGPIARGGFGARAFYLSSPNQFLPAPPPAFGSAAFLAALAEVRQISDTRTPAQLALAQYWHLAQSPRSAEAMNSIARRFIIQYRRKDADAARILFLMNSAAFDAAIGCFHAKFTYWYIRPTQADPMIRLAVPLPPHPAYPSAHSCLSGASTTVMSAMFPSEARYLSDVAQEAGLSRVYAGLHYWFDAEAGLHLGAQVAGLAIAANLDEVATLP